jgi:hypothetical protein
MDAEIAEFTAMLSGSQDRFPARDHQSTPSGVPSAGLQAWYQVVWLIREATGRTLPSAMPTTIAPVWDVLGS